MKGESKSKEIKLNREEMKERRELCVSYTYHSRTTKAFLRGANVLITRHTASLFSWLAQQDTFHTGATEEKAGHPFDLAHIITLINSLRTWTERKTKGEE
jgi:hypothetical protein